MSNEDRQLLDQLANGDRRAFQAIYDRYVRMIYAVCLRVTGNYEDAEEAVQDTFMDLARQGERLLELNSARAWLLRVASCRATDLLRKRSRQEVTASEEDLASSTAPVVTLNFFATPSPDVRDTLAKEELVNRIRELSARLPSRQMLAFSLRHFQSMSIAEVAEAMGCSEGAVKAHLHLALNRMRELAQSEGLIDNKTTIRRKASS